MMLKTKSKGLFVEISEYAILAARTSGLNPPFVIEKLAESPVGTPDEVNGFLRSLMEAKKGLYMPARCGVYTPGRFVRRAALDSPAKAKDPAYLAEFLNQQFRIDPAKTTFAALHAAGGAEVEFEKATPKDIILCGAPSAEFAQAQQTVVDYGIFPESLEIGSVATLGALMSYSTFEGMKSPTLLLEITAENAQVFIFHGNTLDVTRPIPHGLNTMYPVVQAELGLKDEESARKLFFSNTFDFTEMGPALMKKMLKELQASTGFYEVQTGQTIGQIFLSLLPKSLNWMGGALSRSLGVDQLTVNYPKWLASLGITPGEGVELATLDNRWFGLFALMGQYNANAEASNEK